MAKIAIITTSHTEIPNIDVSTGVWYEELSTPYYIFLDAGHDVTLASIKGGDVPFDGRSLAETPLPESVQRFHEDPAALDAAHSSKPIGAIHAQDFDAIFLPGGHGTMWDFPNSPTLTALLAEALGQGKPVAAICHGPAAFVALKNADGSSFMKGRSVTCFTDSEERAVHLDSKIPFLLESSLREMGAHISAGPDFAPHIMEDGNLLTGQNPKSSAPLAECVIAALHSRTARAA